LASINLLSQNSLSMTTLKFIQPNRIPTDSDFLWRYYDIHRFLDLLLNRRFRFSRIDQFEDALEGIPYESLWRMGSLGKEFGIRRTDLLNMPNDFVDRESIKLYSRVDEVLHIQASTFVSCWFLENRESMAMWNLYSNVDGVAIKVNFGKLKTLLNPIIEDVKIKEYYCGKVTYQDLNLFYPDSPDYLSKIPKAALRKDKSFSHENEFRFVMKLKNCDDHQLGIESQIINLKELEMSIICHPQMPDWKKNNIKDLLKSKNLLSSFRMSGIELR